MKEECGCKGGPTKEQLQHLVGKAITDEKFRAVLGEDPVRAGEELGIKFTDKQLDALRELQPKIIEAVHRLDQGGDVAMGPGVLIPIADVGIVAAFV